MRSTHHRRTIAGFLKGSLFRSGAFKAVAAGYLDYKDCDLLDSSLVGLERWAVRHVHETDISRIRETRLLVDASLSAGRLTADVLDGIKELCTTFQDGIMGTDTKSDSATQTVEARYTEVFGEITQKDVDDLTGYLEDKERIGGQMQADEERRAKELDEALRGLFKRRTKNPR